MIELKNESHAKILNGFFYSNHGLLEVLPSCDSEDLYVRGFVAIRDFTQNSINFEDTEKIITSLIFSDSDQDYEIHLFIILFWITYLIGADKFNAANKLLSFASSLINKKTNSELKALFYFAEGFKESYQGNKIKREECFEKAINICAKNSSYFHWILSRCRLFYAELGQLVKFKEKYDVHGPIRKSSKNYPSYFAETVNDIETCNRVITNLDLEKIFNKSSSMDIRIYQKHEKTSYLVQGQLDLYENVYLDNEDAYADSTYFLIKNNKEKALAIIRDEIKRLPNLNLSAGLIYRAPVRAELANGNHEAAFQLIQKYRALGGWHYMDDFYLARVELLRGNREEATEQFNNAYHWCRYFNASQRLDFEIKLSYEIKPEDLWYLSQHLNEKNKGALQIKDSVSYKNHKYGIGRLIGKSQSTLLLKNLIKKYAPMESNILITGETGVGKDVVAKVLHEESSRRKEPYIAINCASIAESLLQSELFGHEVGAFTGAVSKRKGVFEAA
ncbi:MAG: hypothetical protein COA79_25690 [Planctomycetota bacterium]|nr:MAG: hypothetical protein COA79_25690 [Planctomycetota bacterium]